MFEESPHPRNGTAEAAAAEDVPADKRLGEAALDLAEVEVEEIKINPTLDQLGGDPERGIPENILLSAE